MNLSSNLPHQEAQRAAKAQKQADGGIKHKTSAEGTVPGIFREFGKDIVFKRIFLFAFYY